MKKILAFFLALSLVFCNFAQADTFYSWRFRTHATDCTALTDGKVHDICYEQDAQTLYVCLPTAGDCSGSEWKLSPNLIIGTSVQAYDADLTTYASITPSANVQTLLGSANFAAFVASLGLTIGTNTQAYDSDLTTWAGITPGTGVGTALAVNTGSAGAFVVNGGALGTPSSGTLTNATGLPAASVVAGTFSSGSFVFPGTANFTNNAITASGNAATVPITYKFNTVTNNSAATLTITMTTTSAVNGQLVIVNVLDATAAAQTITWVNTENSTNATVPTTSNGSTTLPKVVGFQYNSATSKWRCIASA